LGHICGFLPSFGCQSWPQRSHVQTVTFSWVIAILLEPRYGLVKPNPQQHGAGGYCLPANRIGKKRIWRNRLFLIEKYRHVVEEGFDFDQFFS
jgi:hypothetical protein